MYRPQARHCDKLPFCIGSLVSINSSCAPRGNVSYSCSSLKVRWIVWNGRWRDPGGCLVEVITYIEGNDHWQLRGPGDSLLGTLDDADMPLGGTQIEEDIISPDTLLVWIHHARLSISAQIRPAKKLGYLHRGRYTQIFYQCG